MLDGVFVEDEGGELSFHALPHIANDDVADFLGLERFALHSASNRV